MRKSGKSFDVVVALLVITVIGLILVIGWSFIDRQQATEQQTSGSTNATVTSIHPNENNGAASEEFYTVTMPGGWSVQNVYEPFDMVKTIGSDKYLISSFIEDGRRRNIMEQRVDEGIESVKTVKTSRGTNVSILKTSTVLFLASCKPTGENCYLQLNGKKLYIHLYQVKPSAQSLSDIDYSSESAKQIINDFESIAKSLNL